MKRLRRWWNRLVPTRKALVVLAVVAIVTPLVGLAVLIPQYRARCGPGVSRHGSDQECVGVTDGSYNFPGLGKGLDAVTPDEVLKMIKMENQLVEGQAKPSVTIAYAVPLEKTPSDLNVELRHELEGAYLAQLQANHRGPLGELPLIRLLVANTGKQNGQWKPVVDQLRNEPGSPHPLVAVLGFGESRETTSEAIAALTDQGNPIPAHRDPIPVVTGRLTADNLSLVLGTDSVEGLVRVSPTNSDEAAAASAYLSPNSYKALLIQDDNKSDLYAQSLGSAFTAKFPDKLPKKLPEKTHTLVSRVERYDSSLAGVSDTFLGMMPDICLERPDVVYFAGRETELQEFLAVLPRRTCTDNHVTILTGSDATSLSSAVRTQLATNNRELQVALKANTTLQYTALAHPDAWRAAPASFNSAATDPFRPGCTSCFPTVFGNESLGDGAAIMAYDAVVTVVTATRLPGTPQGTDPKILRGAIIQQWNRIHDCSAVPGASGWISFNDRGNADNKAIPILELTPDGGVKFVQLTSPLGQPFVPTNCSGSP